MLGEPQSPLKREGLVFVAVCRAAGQASVCSSGGAVTALGSIHWTLCSLQGVAEALRTPHTQTRHAVLSTSFSAFMQYVPVILGEDLRRVSKLGSVRSHSGLRAQGLSVSLQTSCPV